MSFMSSIFVWYQCQVLENVFFILRSSPFSLPSFNFCSMLCSLLPSNSNRSIVTPKLQLQKMNVTQFKIASKCVTYTHTHTHTHTERQRISELQLPPSLRLVGHVQATHPSAKIDVVVYLKLLFR